MTFVFKHPSKYKNIKIEKKDEEKKETKKPTKKKTYGRRQHS